MYVLIVLSGVGRDGAVGVTTRYRIESRRRFSASVQAGPGATQHPVQWIMGPFPGGKAAGARLYPRTNI